MLPAALQGLDRQQMTAAIKNAPLGRVDRKIALLRYVERLPLPDIAAQTHYSRTAIGYRLKSIEKIKMPRQHLTHDEAEEWCDNMVNADGTKGCHWTLEQTQDVAKQRNITCDPNDFWAVMNMMYSDYCQVAKRQSVDTPGFYADMAKAFLEDTDAADGKAYLYWDCIADK